MKQVVATTAPKPRSQEYVVLAWIYAAILTGMAVSQLFAFEDFIPLIEAYQLPSGYRTSVLVACLLVVFEIFALPFLLRMRASAAMRWFGAVCSLMVPVMWFALALYGMLLGGGLANGGMLGATDAVTVPLIVQLVISTILCVLAAVIVYGLRTKARS